MAHLFASYDSAADGTSSARNSFPAKFDETVRSDVARRVLIVVIGDNPVCLVIDAIVLVPGSGIQGGWPVVDNCVTPPVLGLHADTGI